jgi:cell division protein FtsL
MHARVERLARERQRMRPPEPTRMQVHETRPRPEDASR